MRNLILILALLAAPSWACELHAVEQPWCDAFGSAGVTHRYDEGYTGASLHAGCAIKDGKYEVSLNGFGAQSLYGGQLKVDPYIALVGQRVWTWRHDKFLRPFLAAGIMLKEQDKCHDTFVTTVSKGSKGSKKPKRKRVFDLDCNRLVPEWWAADFAGGLGFGEHVKAGLHHASNFGTTIPNGGQDYWRVDWLKRF